MSMYMKYKVSAKNSRPMNLTNKDLYKYFKIF